MKDRGTFRPEWLPSWESYAQQRGINLLGHGLGERRAVCDIHGGARDSLCINIKSGAWQCKACGAAGLDVLSHYRARFGVGFVEAAKDLGAWDGGEPSPEVKRATRIVEAHAPDQEAVDLQRRKREKAAAIFGQSRRIEPECPAYQYLVDARACALPPPDSDLRWLPDLRLFGMSGPALVGRMSMATDRHDARGLHLTWFEQVNGQWQRGERRYFGPKSGCVVRLWSDEAVTTGLGVAEGIETALSLAHAFAPVWACMDAGNLAALPVLAGIESLLIAADHDEAGIAAAQACGTRWALAGREVGVSMPATRKTDINDVARAA